MYAGGQADEAQNYPQFVNLVVKGSGKAKLAGMALVFVTRRIKGFCLKFDVFELSDSRSPGLWVVVGSVIDTGGVVRGMGKRSEIVTMREMDVEKKARERREEN